MAKTWGRAPRRARRARKSRRFGFVEPLESRQLLAMVGIVAEDATASEPGQDTGLFRVSMSEFRSTDTQVNYQIGGSATNGQDYFPLSGAVIIPANSQSAVIPVQVIDDQLLEGTETVVITLLGTNNPTDVVDKTPATVNIADNDVNRPPMVTTNTGSTVAEGGVDVITASELTSSDPDTPPSGLVYALTAGPSNGTVRLNGTPTTTFTQADVNAGNVSYLHNGSETISDAFTFSISDGLTTLGGNTFGITVTPVNDAPAVANPIPNQTVPEESAPTSINIGGVFADPDPGDKLTFTVTSSNPAVVNPTISGNTLTLAYGPNQAGTVTITLTATDTKGAQASDVFDAKVTNVNDPVDAKDDAFSTPENTPLTANVLVNDVDPDNLDADPVNDTLSAALLSTTSKGTLSFNANGTFTYTPGPGFAGVDSFTYQATDNKGTFDQAKVTITVTNVNQSPNAGDDKFSTQRNTAVSGNVLINDSDPDNDPLFSSLQTAPVNGSVVLQAAGNFTYTPNADFIGTDTFKYLLSDGQGGTDVGLVTITVSPAPNLDAADDNFTQPEDTTVSGNLLANDIDPDGDPFSLVSTTPPSSGSLATDAKGNFTYTPVLNFFGTDSFTYTIRDAKGFTDTANVTLTFTPVNDVDARNDVFATPQGTPLNVQAPGLLANDVDPDTNPAHQFPFTGVPFSGTTSKGGTVTVNSNGSFSYTPAATFLGADSFTYTIADSVGATDTATVTINVTDINDPPNAVDDAATTPANTSVQINVLANDTDPDPGDVLTVVGVGTAANGQASIGAGGVITYQPNPNFVGTDSFTYSISDGRGGADTATVTVTVRALQGVSANDDSFKVSEDTIRNPLDVLNNDVDPEGDAFKVTAVTQGSKGVVEVGPNGANVLYTPDPNFAGTDSFTYTVTDATGATDTATVSVAVQGRLEPPVAVDDKATLLEDSPPTVIAVLANDSDPDGGTFAITKVTQGANGTVAIRPGGLDLTYQPNPNFFGTDTFTYTITDPSGQTDSASVVVTVEGVLDLPSPVDDKFSAPEDTVVTLTEAQLIANDFNPDAFPIMVTSVSGTVGGTATLNADRSVTFVPAPNFTGDAGFNYTISGAAPNDTGRVTITYSGLNDPPVATDDQATIDGNSANNVINVLANDSDPDGDLLTVTNVTPASNGSTTIAMDGKSVLYTPNPNFFGIDTFTYTASDGRGGTDTATVTVIVFTTPQPPSPVDDKFTATEDQVVTLTEVQITQNDFNPNVTPVDITKVFNPVGGAVVLNADDSVTFTPTLNFTGDASFEYEIAGAVANDHGLVTITYTPVNEVDARDDVFSTPIGVAVFFGSRGVLANDIDPEGDAIVKATLAAGPANGTVMLNGDGSFTYQSNPGFIGTDSFTYTAFDALGASDVAKVTINVIDAAPVARGDAFSVQEGSSQNFIDVLGDDTDPEGDKLRIIAVTQPRNGKVTIVPGGLLYEPDPGFVGIDEFSYTVSDDEGEILVDVIDIALVTVFVHGGGVSYFPMDDDFTRPEDTVVTLTEADLISNDYNPSKLPLDIAMVSNPVGGAVQLNGDGSVTFMPDPNFVGFASFKYRCAAPLDASTARVDIDFTQVFDAPVTFDDSVTLNENTGPNSLNVLSNDVDADGDALLVSAVTQGANGSVAIGPFGVDVIYTPQTNFIGSDSFTYTVTDGNGGTDTATVTVTVLNVDSNLHGTAGDDVFLLRRDPGGTLFEIFANDTGAGAPIFSALIGSTTSLLFDTLAGNDRLIVDFVNGNPIPSGGIDFLGGGNTAVGDQLIIRNGGSTVGSYLPSATLSGEGVVTLDGRNIDLTGVEPIQVSDFASFTAITPNANDVLAITQPDVNTTQLAGTSGGVAFSSISFSNIGTFIIDAAANDAGAGNDALTITGSTPIPNGTNFLEYRSGTGTNTLDAQSGVTRIDTTVAAGGTLDTTVGTTAELVTHRFRQTSLTLAAGSNATVLSAGTLDAVSRLNALNIGTGATLDINDNALVLDYTGASPEATIRAKIIEGRGGVGIGNGNWNGTGITSGAAAAANATDPESRSIGYADNGTLPLGAYTTFRGQAVDATAVLIAFTRTGDANLDSLVNDDDVTILGAFFPGTNSNWASGDFDYTDTVDDNDATLLGAFYDPGATPFPAAAPPMASAREGRVHDLIFEDIGEGAAFSLRRRR